MFILMDGTRPNKLPKLEKGHVKIMREMEPEES